MRIELSVAWTVALNVGGWLVIQLGLAWAFTRMPLAWFQPGSPRATTSNQQIPFSLTCTG